MLELSLSGGGLWGMTLSGFLYGLRDRRFIPEIVTGISSGVHAGYLAYSNSDYEAALRWFQNARDHMKSKPLGRFFPPYDRDGQAINCFTRPFLVSPNVFHSNGLKHFFVGYVNLKQRRFVAEDILQLNEDVTYRVILRSSTIPFLTNFVPHFEGFIDGGFSRRAFLSALPTSERWLITYEGSEKFACSCQTYQRKILLPKLSRYTLYASDTELRTGFEKGYELADKLTF